VTWRINRVGDYKPNLYQAATSRAGALESLRMTASKDEKPSRPLDHLESLAKMLREIEEQLDEANKPPRPRQNSN
jgi:hypothetical protein